MMVELIGMAARWYFKSQAEANITAGTNATENQTLLDYIERQIAHVSVFEAMIGFTSIKHGAAWAKTQRLMMAGAVEDVDEDMLVDI